MSDVVPALIIIFPKVYIAKGICKTKHNISNSKNTLPKNGSSCSIENQPCKTLSKFSSSKNSKLHKKNLWERP